MILPSLSKSLPNRCSAPQNLCLQALHFSSSSTAKKFYPSRKRLTLPIQPGSKEKLIVLSGKKSIKEYADDNNLTVVFKDLGPQSDLESVESTLFLP